MQIGGFIISDDCHRISTCQASGVILSRNMTCNTDESCQIKNGVMGCYLKQCLLGSNGTLTPFSGADGTITEPGAYEVIQVCDQAQTSDWFRVVVKLEICSPGVNTIVAVYVFLSELVITVDSKHNIWVSVLIMMAAFMLKAAKIINLSF